MQKTITAIDIGSCKIKTVIAKFDDTNKQSGVKFHIMGVGAISTSSIRKGNILDMEEFKHDLNKSLEEAERMAGEQVDGAYICFNSSSREIVNNRGIIAVSRDEISYEDVTRVLDMAKSGVEVPNREILKVIPDTFVVDLEEGIKSPVGMTARKLEVRANIISVAQNVLNNLRKAVNDVGVHVIDMYPNIIASPEAVLTKRQKELGVVSIDIGASTTGITVYEEGTLKFARVIPLGGESVTNDIALGLRTSIDTAEKLKLEYGSLLMGDDESFKEVSIDLSRFNKQEQTEVSKKYLCQIITARYDEILSFVKRELKAIGKDGMLPEGAVFIGGGAKIKGLVEYSKELLRLPVSIGLPLESELVSDTSISDPAFNGVIGAIILADKYNREGESLNLGFSSILGSITKVIKKVLPF